MATFPKYVKVVEVGPRDGLQNEPEFVPTSTKVEFINRLTKAGLKHIEVTSFVSPRWVPQLADSGEVFKQIEKPASGIYSALVPNAYGMERAIEAGTKHIAVFSAASETFNQHNINASVDESLNRIEKVMVRAKEHDLVVRGYVSTCFGCPYEGDVDPAKVSDLAQRLIATGVDEISLGDTNGVATPAKVFAVLDALLPHVDIDKVAVHFHDTHGRALANVSASLQAGISIVDSSAGGLGGCPYSPGATGNLATEDLLALLHDMGIETGVDLDQLIEVSLFMEQALGRELPSRHLKTVRCRR